MSWGDLYIILTTCCSPEENKIWEEAHKYADKLHAQNPDDVGPAAQPVSD